MLCRFFGPASDFFCQLVAAVRLVQRYRAGAEHDAVDHFVSLVRQLAWLLRWAQQKQGLVLAMAIEGRALQIEHAVHQMGFERLGRVVCAVARSTAGALVNSELEFIKLERLAPRI